MPNVDREHTTHYESCGCSEVKNAELRATVKELRAEIRQLAKRINSAQSDGFDAGKYVGEDGVRCLEARVRELEAALNRIRDKLAMRTRPLPSSLASIEQIAAAALKEAQ